MGKHKKMQINKLYKQVLKTVGGSNKKKEVLKVDPTLEPETWLGFSAIRYHY